MIFLFQGRRHKVFDVRMPWGTEHLFLAEEHYTHGDKLAIQAYCIEDGEVEPYATLTVNLDGIDHEMQDGKALAFVDTNNYGDWVEPFIRDNDLAKPEGYIGQSGFCLYPLYRWDTAAFYED